MSSQVTRDLLRKRPGMTVAIMMGRHGGDGMPGQDRPYMGPESSGPDAHGMGGDQERQMAYEKVIDGLQVLADHYPEAGDMLQQFETMYAKWMSGKTMGPTPPSAQGEEEGAHEESPPDDSAMSQGPGAGSSEEEAPQK